MSAIQTLLLRWLGRLLEPGLNSARSVASEVIDDVGDRAALLGLEAQGEAARLLRLALFAFSAVLLGIVTLVWVSAGVVLLAWDTANRNLALFCVVAAWALAAVTCAVLARTTARDASRAFALSRELARADLAAARRYLSETTP